MTEKQKTPPGKKEFSARRRWFWSILFLVIAAASVITIASQSKDFSPSDFLDYLHNASPFWVVISVCAVLLTIFFEGAAILIICRTFGYPRKLRNGLFYSASDIYFSAITPSATGGQPASAFFMIRDGIPVAVSTVVLLTNLIAYASSILLIGVLCFLLYPGVFLRFGVLSKVLILVGCGAQVGLALGFLLLLRREKILLAISGFFLRLFGKIHLIHRVPEKMERLERTMEEYRSCAGMIKGHWKMMIGVLLCNFAQRALQIFVTAATFLATGGPASEADEIWALQSYVVLGSNCVPIPGAVGVSDYLMIDGFSAWMEQGNAIRLELFARSLSFYLCVFLCGILTLIGYGLIRKRRTLEQ